MTNTPLNPDGVWNAMDTLMAETDTDERATVWAHKVTTRVLEGYFAVAQPEVNKHMEGNEKEYGVTREYVELVMDDIRTSRFDRDFEFYLVKDLLIEVWDRARWASDDQANPFDSW